MNLFGLLVAGAAFLFMLWIGGVGRPLGARPPAIDFAAFWSAGKLAGAGQLRALYDNSVIEAFERANVSMPAQGYLAFYYPPPFLLLCVPLGLLPYVWALLVFLAAQAALFWTALRRILRARWALVPILAYPGFLMNGLSGQNGGLTATAFAGAMIFLESRPFLGGACLGTLVYKPQMALIVPVALLSARRWRSAFGAGVTALGICAASFAVLGAAPWRGFLANSGAARSDLEHLHDKLYMMQSFYADLRLGGAGVAAGYGGQALLAAMAILVLVHVCWRRAGAGAEMASLAASTLLCTPFLYDYDLVVLAPALAWLAATASCTRLRLEEGMVVGALYLLPLSDIVVRAHIGLPLAPPFVFCALVLIWRRAVGLSPGYAPVAAEGTRW